MAAERYTVVFTGLFDLKKPGEYPYLTLGEETPESGGYSLHRGRPPYGELGQEIGSRELPLGNQKLVTEIYLNLWGLTG